MKKTFLMICAAALLAASLPVLAEEETNMGETPVEQTIDWKAFMIDDPETYVTLGDYTDLEVTKSVYTVTEEDTLMEMDGRLSAFSTTEPVDRTPEEGDILTMDITITADGETFTEKDFQLEYGFGYLGETFDEELEGVQAGETRSFSITYGEDAEIEGWENQTVDFQITVTAVETIVVPELTDDWVKENTEYDNVDAYTESVREDLQKDYDRQSDLDAAATLLSLAMDNASFHDYPDDMYDAAYNQAVSQYAMMADMFGMSLEDLLDSYGMTDEDLDDEATETVNSYLIVNAIAKAESITVTEEDVQKYASENYLDYGYEDAEEMIGEAEEGELEISALQDKVNVFLLEHADVTVTEAPADEEDYYLDDSSAIDLTLDDEDWEDEDWEDDEDTDWEEDTDDMAELDWSDLDLG